MDVFGPGIAYVINIVSVYSYAGTAFAGDFADFGCCSGIFCAVIAFRGDFGRFSGVFGGWPTDSTTAVTSVNTPPILNIALLNASNYCRNDPKSPSSVPIRVLKLVKTEEFNLALATVVLALSADVEMIVSLVPFDASGGVIYTSASGIGARILIRKISEIPCDEKSSEQIQVPPASKIPLQLVLKRVTTRF